MCPRQAKASTISTQHTNAFTRTQTPTQIDTYHCTPTCASARAHTHTRSHVPRQCTVWQHSPWQFEMSAPSVCPRVPMNVCEGEDVWGYRTSISWMSAIQKKKKSQMYPIQMLFSQSALKWGNLKEHNTGWSEWTLTNHRETEEASVPEDALGALCWVSGSWDCLLSNLRRLAWKNYNS